MPVRSKGLGPRATNLLETSPIHFSFGKEHRYPVAGILLLVSPWRSLANAGASEINLDWNRFSGSLVTLVREPPDDVWRRFVKLSSALDLPVLGSVDLGASRQAEL